jgi:hypothetical protein
MLQMNELSRQMSKALEAVSLSADSFHRKLQQRIEETLKELKDDEQLAVYYQCRTGECIAVTDIGYRNPNLIIICGQDSQRKHCQILAHMNLVELVMKKEKVDKKAKPRTIGFIAN